jgi:carboxymethylenebutenolidase
MVLARIRLIAGGPPERTARVPLALGLSFLVAVATISAFGAGLDSPGLKETTEVVSSRGSSIVVDVLAPEEGRRHPAVVLLHGTGGLGEGMRSELHEMARALARSGYVALVPRYFGKAVPDRKAAHKNARSFRTWVRNADAVVAAAARRPDVEPGRVGVLGVSLGSWVALSVAALDRRVSAVVEYSGGFPAWEDLDPTRLPPVLILHGDADRNVPVAQAHELDDLLDRAGVPHETHIYPGADHGLRGTDRLDALSRTLTFLDSHLKANHVDAATRSLEDP